MTHTEQPDTEAQVEFERGELQAILYKFNNGFASSADTASAISSLIDAKIALALEQFAGVVEAQLAAMKGEAE